MKFEQRLTWPLKVEFHNTIGQFFTHVMVNGL